MNNTTLTAATIETHVAKRIADESPYPFLLVYVQEFTSGVLKGKIVQDLPFGSENGAQEWVSKINAKNTRGGINYRVVEHVIRRIGAGS